MQKKLPLRRRGYIGTMRALMYLSAGLTAALVLFLIGYVLLKGVPNISWELLSTAPSYLEERIGILPDILNTLYLVMATILFVLPLGVCAAIYLNEYASNKKLVAAIEYAAETLSGIPSIIYGLFGMLFFVTYLKWKYSLLAGGLTLSIMILPLIMRTTEEALLAVPASYREASFGLGAGRLRTVFRVVLPSAIPGILAGVILAIGRIVGETAALIYTAGTVAQVPPTLLSSGRTLAVHMYLLSSEGLNTNQAYATAVVLLILVVLINGLSSLVSRKLSKGKQV